MLLKGPIFLLALTAQVSGEATGDEIKSLPGWDRKKLPNRQWSGYVNVTLENNYKMSVHYYYLEAEDQAESKPLVLWSNGGPGASSIFGIMVELGPLLLNDDSLKTDEYKRTGIPTLLRNDYAWTKLASVLIFDWPPPVGFSYCNGNPRGNGTSCGVWNDTLMASLEKLAVDAFFETKFPELAEREFYLIGESYSGVYTPLLVEKLIEDNSSTIKGFAVGDACAGTDVLCGSNDAPWWDLIFLYGHGQISNQAFDSILNTCGIEALKSRGITLSNECAQAISYATATVGWYYEYNLYDTCTYQEGLRRRRLEALTDYPCGGGLVQDMWVNLSSVREALHVPLDSFFYSADGDDTVYKLTETDVRRVYRSAAEKGLRMLVYNGDTDPGINSFVSQNWTSTIFPLKEEWRPWTLDNCLAVAGYVIQYEQDLQFLTIRGSGHMVPEFKSIAAYTFLSDWLAGNDFKVYDAECSSPSFSSKDDTEMII
mmetsp:Transcript_13124/g.19639  ORF Transcript_13124/g.19639 Transcript_13124/m.19639 type:complete len:484 (+) Transcript_13124:74-1525(+)